MPRKPRSVSPFGLYHIVVKGADRQLMFEEKNDYLKYLDMLSYYQDKFGIEIYAYCLMSNHVHLLVRIPDIPLDSFFRGLNTCYAVWFNMKYDRTGFLQQGRYHSEAINDFSQLFAAIRYIHRNPCKAGLEKSPGEKYVWSSIYAYTKGSPSVVNTEFVLNLFGGLAPFKAFHMEKNDDSFLDIETTRKRLPDDVAKEIIANTTNCFSVKDFQKLSIAERNKNILLLSSKGISIRQMNRLTGIPRGVIERVLAKEKHTQ